MLADRMKPRKPSFDTWLETLKPEHRKIIDGWLTDKTIPATAVARAVYDDDPDDNFIGYKANHDTILRWRRAHGVV